MICCPLDSLGSTSHGATTKTTGEQHIMILFAGCPGADQQGRQRTDCNEGDADADADADGDCIWHLGRLKT